MSYNNGFPTNQTYTQVGMPQVGYTQYMQNQPQTYVQQTPQQPSSTFNQIIDDKIMVQGVENAKLYPIAPNTMATLWDINDKYFYRVTANSPIRIYEYHELTSNNTEEQNVTMKSDDVQDVRYVTYDELDKYVEELINIKLNNNKIVEPQSDSSDTISKPRRTMSKTKGDK